MSGKLPAQSAPKDSVRGTSDKFFFLDGASFDFLTLVFVDEIDASGVTTPRLLLGKGTGEVAAARPSTAGARFPARETITATVLPLEYLVNLFTGRGLEKSGERVLFPLACVETALDWLDGSTSVFMVGFMAPLLLYNNCAVVRFCRLSVVRAGLFIFMSCLNVQVTNL